MSSVLVWWVSKAPYIGVIPHWCVLLWCALVWRISLWRLSFWHGSSSARFSLARFHFGAFLFGAFPNFVRTYGICERQFRADYLCACFLSAEKSCQSLLVVYIYVLICINCPYLRGARMHPIEDWSKYSRTCLGRPPLVPIKSGRSRQVVSHNRSGKNHVPPMCTFYTQPGSRPMWDRHVNKLLERGAGDLSP